jgi:bacterioferritin-associated ferredoxin
MIVCCCHAVSDRTLREAAAAGLSHDEIESATGAGTACGVCREAVADIVTQSHGPCRGAEACPGCPRRVAA